MYKFFRIGLLFCLLCGVAKAQIRQLPDLQPANNEDSLSNEDNYTHYHYLSLTLFSGGSVLIMPKAMMGRADISFPYTSTDATTGITTNRVFQSSLQKVFNNPKLEWDLLGFEFGGLRYFFTSNWSFDLNTRIVGNVSGGYGHMWYFNGLGEHANNVIDKRFVLKASMNVVYDVNDGNIGIIDNTNSTINVLGLTANPQYTETTSDDDGNTETDTYSAQNLNISYVQKELSLSPRISIGNNPYGRKGIFVAKDGTRLLWELSIGYNIPIYDWGGIELDQDDGNSNDNTNGIGGTISLKNPSLTFIYNGEKRTSTPFRLSGIYIALTFRLGDNFLR
jgi:hypothetical protein